MWVCPCSRVHACVHVSVVDMYTRVCPCVCVFLSACPCGPVYPAQLSGCVLSAYIGLTGCLSWAVCPQVFGYNTSEEGLCLGSLTRLVTVEGPCPVRGALRGLLAFAWPWLHM